MNKESVKMLLMSMRNAENEKIINKMLGGVDIMDEKTFQNAVEQVGGTEEAVRKFFENKIVERQNAHTEEHIPINDMFSYGVLGKVIHLHLPVDLHGMIAQKGVSGTVDTVNLYLLDAIDRIKSLKDEGYYRFQGKDSIYMISPILLGRKLKFLEGLDFQTNTYRKKELGNEEFLKSNPEARLAKNIFGEKQNVGTAKIKFDTIDSSEWQKKKKNVVENFKNKGILFSNEKSAEI